MPANLLVADRAAYGPREGLSPLAVEVSNSLLSRPRIADAGHLGRKVSCDRIIHVVVARVTARAAKSRASQEAREAAAEDHARHNGGGEVGGRAARDRARAWFCELARDEDRRGPVHRCSVAEATRRARQGAAGGGGAGQFTCRARPARDRSPAGERNRSASVLG